MCDLLNYNVNTIAMEVPLKSQAPLLTILCGQEVMKGVIIKYNHVQPKDSVAPDEELNVLIFASGIDVTNICDRLNTLKSWLGKPMKAECDMATENQLRFLVNQSLIQHQSTCRPPSMSMGNPNHQGSNRSMRPSILNVAVDSTVTYGPPIMANHQDPSNAIPNLPEGP